MRQDQYRLDSLKHHITTLDPATLGYIAGIIDGEGSLSPLNNDYPRIGVWMTHKETMAWVTEQLGVTLRTYHYAKRYKRLWGFRLHGREALIVLSAIRPYLITKAERADQFLTWTPQAAGNKPLSHCLRGHEFTPENTRYKQNGTKTCKECQRRRDLERTKRWRLEHATD